MDFVSVLRHPSNRHVVTEIPRDLEITTVNFWLASTAALSFCSSSERPDFHSGFGAITNALLLISFGFVPDSVQNQIFCHDGVKK